MINTSNISAYTNQTYTNQRGIEKYKKDPRFRTLVDSLYDLLKDGIVKRADILDAVQLIVEKWDREMKEIGIRIEE